MAHLVVRAQGREGRRDSAVGDFIQVCLKWKMHKALEIMPSCIWFQWISELYSQVLTYSTLSHSSGNSSITPLEQGPAMAEWAAATEPPQPGAVLWDPTEHSPAPSSDGSGGSSGSRTTWAKPRLPPTFLPSPISAEHTQAHSTFPSSHCCSEHRLAWGRLIMTIMLTRCYGDVSLSHQTCSKTNTFPEVPAEGT